MSLATYTNPWRPLYEAYAIAMWAVIGASAWITATWWDLYAPAFYGLSIASALMVLSWMPGLIHGIERRERMRAREMTFIEPQEFAERMPGWAGNLWLGWGFEWRPKHAQEALDLLRTGIEDYAPRDPKLMGALWIHGIGGTDTAVEVPLGHIEGHTLVVGTTGCGKTRLFDVMVTQAVLRGEAVIIIDPKGDRDLRQAAERACALSGDPKRFVYFHPAFPEESVRIDPLRNYARPTEVASRVAQLIPSETGMDAFKAFGQMALSHIVHALIEIGEKPNLATLRRYIDGGADGLMVKVLRRYFDARIAHWDEHIAPYTGRARDTAGLAKGMLAFYRARVQDTHPSNVIEGLASMVEHASDHFTKMVASLKPILVMLTSAHLEEMLSPNDEDVESPYTVTSLSEVIRRRQVLFLGLDSLSDGIVGSAIGSMFTADLAAIAGAIYANEAEPKPVSVFVDEAAETVSDPLIQLLNKGRGAGYTLSVATQSFSDFAARLGSPDKARQVLANLNNKIAMRILDAETQEYMAEALPEVRLRTVTQTQGASTASDAPALYTGTLAERLDEAEAPLFPTALFGEMPNFEYLAIFAGGRVVKGRLPILGTRRAGLRDVPTPIETPILAPASQTIAPPPPPTEFQEDTSHETADVRAQPATQRHAA